MLFEEVMEAVEIGSKNGEGDIDFRHIHSVNKYCDGYVDVSIGDVRVVYSQ